ncbi:MAG: hypothetical protein MI974_13305 [Chitinophagales bacterium]|nr:hypothetical protein [Chitinophagales bacterium]
MSDKIHSYEIDGNIIFIETTNVEVEKDDDNEILTVSRNKDKGNKAGRSFDKLMNTLESISNSVSETAKSLGPDEFEIELGLSISGEMGIPFVTKTASEGTLKVTIKWKKEKSNGDEQSK